MPRLLDKRQKPLDLPLNKLLLKLPHRLREKHKKPLLLKLRDKLCKLLLKKQEN